MEIWTAVRGCWNILENQFLLDFDRGVFYKIEKSQSRLGNCLRRDELKKSVGG